MLSNSTYKKFISVTHRLWNCNVLLVNCIGRREIFQSIITTTSILWRNNLLSVYSVATQASLNRFVVSYVILNFLKLIETCCDNETVLHSYNTDGIYVSNPRVMLKQKSTVEFSVKHIGRPFVTDWNFLILRYITEKVWTQRLRSWKREWTYFQWSGTIRKNNSSLSNGQRC